MSWPHICLFPPLPKRKAFPMILGGLGFRVLYLLTPPPSGRISQLPYHGNPGSRLIVVKLQYLPFLFHFFLPNRFTKFSSFSEILIVVTRAMHDTLCTPFFPPVPFSPYFFRGAPDARFWSIQKDSPFTKAFLPIGLVLLLMTGSLCLVPSTQAVGVSCPVTHFFLLGYQRQ